MRKVYLKGEIKLTIRIDDGASLDDAVEELQVIAGNNEYDVENVSIDNVEIEDVT